MARIWTLLCSFLEYYRRLYKQTENWFTIKYSAQCLFFIVFFPILYYGMPEYVGKSGEESQINVEDSFNLLIDTKRTTRTCCCLHRFYWIYPYETLRGTFLQATRGCLASCGSHCSPLSFVLNFPVIPGETIQLKIHRTQPLHEDSLLTLIHLLTI